MLEPKYQKELAFWQNIARNGWRGFSPTEWRKAHIHFKQYSLIHINRSVADLTNKTVIEVGCGPAGIVPHLPTPVTAFGVDPLMDEYKKLWDLSEDNVKYLASDIENLTTNIKADVVICWNVLDHVSHIEKTNQKLYDLLKSNGELWLLVNLEDKSLWGKITGKIIKSNPDKAHPFRLNHRSLSRLLKKHGFYWQEKVLMKELVHKRCSTLMGVLGKKHYCNIWDSFLAKI